MGRIRVGMIENVGKIEDVDLVGNDGEDLFLGYKTSSFFLGAGVFLKDDGYVLGVEGGDGYYELGDDAELASLQASGLLPAPLPEYSIPLAEYAFGFSLWIVLAGIVGFGAVKRLFSRADAGEAGADAGSTAAA